MRNSACLVFTALVAFFPLHLLAADPVKSDISTEAERLMSRTRLQRAALAMFNFVGAEGQFPDDIRDGNGKPLLSWRVSTLPMTGNKEDVELYQQFRLDEPWDSEHNKKLLAKVPALFECRPKSDRPGDTNILRVSGTGTLFEPGKKLHDGDIPDGADKTLLLIESAERVPWTKPTDLSFTPGKPAPKWRGPFSNVVNVAFADGQALSLRPDLPEVDVLALITRGGKDKAPDRNAIAFGRPKDPKEEQQLARDMLRRILDLRKQSNEMQQEIERLELELTLLKGNAPPLTALEYKLQGAQNRFEENKKQLNALKAEIKKRTNEKK